MKQKNSNNDNDFDVYYKGCNKCPFEKTAMKFIKYDPSCKYYRKNYSIEYECRFCCQMWMKLMSSKEDDKPIWEKIHDIDDEEIQKRRFDELYGVYI